MDIYLAIAARLTISTAIHLHFDDNNDDDDGDYDNDDVGKLFIYGTHSKHENM